VLQEPRGSGRRTLGESIDSVLRGHGLGQGQQAERIAELWRAARLPGRLIEELLAAYRRLDRGGGSASGDAEAAEGPLVAIRSSSREEDTEDAARAGEFRTFLFVRGAASLLAHLKQAWSGLWTERAIHNRAVFGTGGSGAGGGVIVQRMIGSRVSGVLQTVNVAAAEPREIVINAGLGLGEGVVGGVVPVDQFSVLKEGDSEREPLRFRCITACKTEQVVFNRRAGGGTVRVETPSHQRLRSALDYVELQELVRLAVRLESAFGYPLDIEFAIEGDRIWILQVRPVARHAAVLRETLEHRPLRSARTERARDRALEAS